MDEENVEAFLSEAEKFQAAQLVQPLGLFESKSS